jgi:Tol biopolymer transport system component
MSNQPIPMRRWLAAALASVAAGAMAQTARVDSLTYADPQVRGFQSAEADRTDRCCQPRISGNGRHVLFVSRASNVVPDDHNGDDDLFWRDRQTGATRIVNLRSDGRPARSDNTVSEVAGSISDDGRLVAFSTRQSDVVPGDTNLASDIFLHDTSDGSTVLLVRGAGGAQADAGARNPSISATGRYVAFESASTNLVAGPAGTAEQVYLLDRDTGVIERISVTPGGQPSLAGGRLATVSDDGRFVAFLSGGDDLVAGAPNDGREQLFVRDRQLGITRRLSERAGAPADDAVTRAQIAGNGSAVAFETRAGNLVPGGTSLVRDVYVVSTAGGSISQVSLTAAGTQPDRDSGSPSISRGGRRIAFDSSAVLASGGVADSQQVYLRDVDTGLTALVSLNNGGANGNDAEFEPHLSADGQVVGFHALSSDLVSTDSNQVADRFVRDLGAGLTERISLADASGPFPSHAFAVAGTGSTADPGESSLATRGQRQLSVDGRYAAFSTTSRFLGSTQITVSGSQVVRVDRSDAGVDWISRRRDGGSPLTNGSSSDAAISGDGRFVVFRSNSTVLVPGDNNNAFDVFLFDTDQDQMERVNLGPGDIQALGGQAFLPTVSDDGNAIAFSSTQNNLVSGDTNGVSDVFVRLRATATTRRASVGLAGAQANGASDLPVLSANGRFVVFTSVANNLVSGDTNGLQDIFRHDLQTGETARVSVSSGGAQANGNSFVSAVSADGEVVAFTSAASNLVAGDSNGVTDVFVRDFTTGTTTRVSVNTTGAQANGASTDPSISADGRHVGFMSSASNLVAGDDNLQADFFRHDREGARTIRLSVDPEGRQSRSPSSTITTGTLGPDGEHALFASNVTRFELDLGVAGLPTGRAILLSVPASEPLPEALFANGFE